VEIPAFPRRIPAVRRRMYDSEVRPEAAILEGFSEPYRALPLSARFIFLEFDRLSHFSFTALSRYHHPHTRRTV
jgi:hypothetical protein